MDMLELLPGFFIVNYFETQRYYFFLELLQDFRIDDFITEIDLTQVYRVRFQVKIVQYVLNDQFTSVTYHIFNQYFHRKHPVALSAICK